MPADKPSLHLDADASIKALYQALIDRGHDVTRTPNEWMPETLIMRPNCLGQRLKDG
jgi:hypothetical protein